LSSVSKQPKTFGAYCILFYSNIAALKIAMGRLINPKSDKKKEEREREKGKRVVCAYR
jgi:hypothetical protein